MKINVKKFTLNAVKSLLLPAIIFVFFFIASGGVFGSFNSLTAAVRNSVVGIIIAFGMLFVMSSGMWDMSLGAVVYVSGMIGGYFAVQWEIGVVGMILVSIVAAIILFAFTSLVYTYLKVPSLIVGLGLVLVYEMLTVLLFDKKHVSIPASMGVLGRSPYCYLVLIAAIIVMSIIWRYTKVAKNIKAVGNNPQIAANIGVNVSVTKMKAFLLAGVFVGLGGVLQMSSVGSISPVESMASVDLVFDAMITVFIAEYLSKYCGMVAGVIIGSISVRLLNTGLISIGLPSAFQNVALGLFLIVFIAISTNLGRFLRYFEDKKRAETLNKVILKG